jgi:hypothetical protein
LIVLKGRFVVELKKVSYISVLEGYDTFDDGLNCGWTSPHKKGCPEFTQNYRDFLFSWSLGSRKL